MEIYFTFYTNESNFIQFMKRIQKNSESVSKFPKISYLEVEPFEETSPD